MALTLPTVERVLGLRTDAENDAPRPDHAPDRVFAHKSRLVSFSLSFMQLVPLRKVSLYIYVHIFCNGTPAIPSEPPSTPQPFSNQKADTAKTKPILSLTVTCSQRLWLTATAYGQLASLS